MLSTKETLQSQWKTVVVKKEIVFSSTFSPEGELPIQLLHAPRLRHPLGQQATSTSHWCKVTPFIFQHIDNTLLTVKMRLNSL